MESVEYVLLIAIVIFQIVIFVQLITKIFDFSRIFSSSYQVVKQSYAALENQVEDELEILEEGYYDEELALYIDPVYTEKEIIESEIELDEDFYLDSDTNNKYLGNIVKTINAYLDKNRGTVVDFHILKDIVERNVETLEEEITTRIPAPLYLGLAATMIGIILGLWGINDVSNPDSMTPLINGVKWAMSASVVGLVLTTLSSIWIFKNGKKNSEEGKNEFLSFLQTELLPKMSKSEDAGIEELNHRLNEFGHSSVKIVNDLDTIVSRTSDSIEREHELIRELNEIDIKKVAEYNVTVFNQLSKMMEDFQAFPKYYNELNASLSNTTKLNDNLIKLLENSSDVGEAIAEVKNISEKSNGAFTFFNKHIESFVKYEDAVNKAVAVADDEMGKAIGSLQESVTKQFDKHSIVIAESQNRLEDIIKEYIKTLGNATDPRFNKLDKLEGIDQSLNEIKHSIQQQTKALSSLGGIQMGSSSGNAIDNDSTLNVIKNYLQIGAYAVVSGLGVYLLFRLVFNLF